MNPIDEIEFIHRLPLRNFHRKPIGFNFSCPLCGEGKSPWKHRAWIIQESKNFSINFFHCWNCGVKTNIEIFLKMVDLSLYEEFKRKDREYFLASLKEGKLNKKRPGRVANTFLGKEKDLKLFILNPSNFIPLRQHKEGLVFALKRKIPQEKIDHLLFCIHLKCQWTDMIIFPLWKEDKVYGFQGRSIKKKKFATFCKNEGFKVFNIFDVDLSKKVFVFESIIDSFFVDNSIAMLGSDLSEAIQIKLRGNEVYCFDNDQTGYDRAITYLEKGKKIVCYPDSFNCKDLNEVVIKENWSKEQISKMLNANIIEGQMGIVKIKLKTLQKKKR